MANYPFQFNDSQTLQTDVSEVFVDRGFIAKYVIPAAKATGASNNGIKTAVTSTAGQSVVTTGIVQPSVPRNITATAGGTATDIKAISVIIVGTNFNDEAITETLPAFTLDTAGTVAGSKAFKTVTSITIPAHDGTGATTAIGFGEVLGIPYKLSLNTIIIAYRNSSKETVLPVVVISASALEANTFKLNNSLNSTKVDLFLIV